MLFVPLLFPRTLKYVYAVSEKKCTGLKTMSHVLENVQQVTNCFGYELLFAVHCCSV